MEVINKKARSEFEFLERFEAGIVLTGAEVKAIRQGKVNLNESYARFMSGELFLVNMQIEGGTGDSSRSRKLLMRKGEIVSLGTKVEQQKLTIIPLKLYNSDPHIKVELALARRLKNYQKRDKLKGKDLDREAERELKVH